MVSNQSGKFLKGSKYSIRQMKQTNPSVQAILNPKPTALKDWNPIKVPKEYPNAKSTRPKINKSRKGTNKFNSLSLSIWTATRPPKIIVWQIVLLMILMKQRYISYSPNLNIANNSLIAALTKRNPTRYWRDDRMASFSFCYFKSNIGLYFCLAISHTKFLLNLLCYATSVFYTYTRQRWRNKTLNRLLNNKFPKTI